MAIGKNSTSFSVVQFCDVKTSNVCCAIDRFATKYPELYGGKNCNYRKYKSHQRLPRSISRSLLLKKLHNSVPLHFVVSTPHTTDHPNHSIPQVIHAHVSDSQYREYETSRKKNQPFVAKVRHRFCCCDPHMNFK